MLEIARRESAKIIFEGKDISQLLGLSARWHKRRVDQLNTIREFPLAKGEHWHPVLKPSVVFVDEPATETEDRKIVESPINEWQIVNLHNSDDLKHEGYRMGHCIGGSSYQNKGLAGQSHYFSIRDAEGNPVSTIEAQLSHGTGDINIGNGMYLKVIQHECKEWGQKGNTEKVLQWFSNQFSDSEITPSFEVDTSEIGRDQSFVKDRPPLINMIGMENPEEAKRRQQNFDLFVARGGGVMKVGNDYLVPKDCRKMTVDDFIAKMDLGEVKELLGSYGSKIDLPCRPLLIEDDQAHRVGKFDVPKPGQRVNESDSIESGPAF